MEEIDKFKKNSNGAYVKYSAKELVAGLHTKIDKINDRLVEGDKKIAKLETNVSWLNKAIISLYTLIGALLIGPIKKLFEWLMG